MNTWKKQFAEIIKNFENIVIYIENSENFYIPWLVNKNKNAIFFLNMMKR